MKKQIPIAVADLIALADGDGVPDSFLLLPYGEIEYTKGTTRGHMTIDAAAADAILADFQRRGKDIVIDYEHQTLSGEQAPAAGWIDRLEKTAAGVVAHVRAWTDKAREYLSRKEYRYHSPVMYSPEGSPGIHSAALTNHPAIHGLPALVWSDSVDAGNLNLVDGGNPSKASTQQEDAMNEELKKVAEKLGVSVVALADGDGMNVKDTLSAILTKLDDMLGNMYALKNFLTLHDAKDLEEVTGVIKGMVPASELNALNDRLAGIEAEKAVAKAFDDRKLVEAQREWATGYAKKDIQAFSDFVEKAPVIAPAPASEIDVGKTAGAGGVVALTDAERKIFRAQGLSPEQITKIEEGRKAAQE